MGNRWLEYMVQRLIKNGHRFQDIPEYTLAQASIFLDAIDREEAGARADFLTDLGVTISGVLGGSDGFEDHLNLIKQRQSD